MPAMSQALAGELYLAQPIPKVKRGDVELVARSDYPPEGAVALDVLKGCNEISLGEHRIHLAILKLGIVILSACDFMLR